MAQANRRSFLQHTGASAAAAAAAATLASASLAADDDRPTVVGLIGPGGMGTAHLKQLATNKRVKLAYVCDVDQNRLAAAAKAATDLSGAEPKAVSDMRQIFADPAVEAVWIATPDHWHAPAAILACQAGKHVYVEKPCSHNVHEGRLMIEAARRHNRVLQVGTQSRSTTHVIKAIERLREGAIGEVLVAKAWNSQLRGSIGHAKPSDPPPALNYDLWLGPVEHVPYQSNFLHGIWRWWHHFGAGDMGNDGVHDIDLACWGLGVTTHPTSVAALGGKYFFDDDQQFPDTQYVVFEYPGGKGERSRQLVYEQRIWSPYVQEGYENGNAYYGTKGMLLLGKGSGYKLYGPRMKLIEEVTGSLPDLAAHHENFLDCIRSGARPHADIEINHLSTALCHLGNIATRVRRTLTFDPATEQITGDDQAAALLRRAYRAGHWAAPQEA